MGLKVGTKIGPYEIVAPLGAGGMGEVYRARDTKLGRDVALKVLPTALLVDSTRRALFQREAEVLASLNHSGIAAIYGLQESDGTRALIIELVEGPTLAERLAAGPMTFEEALPVARQMAEALEYAHEKGVVHRDLKPANVKIGTEGNVKLLDFGLAKALDAASAMADPLTSPTLTHVTTGTGMIMGTAAYMAPEQARGVRVDRRADIWSFGVVLYEMLTARKAFSGETMADVLAAVVRAEPDWRALPSTTPSRILDLLKRCVQKDRMQRLQAIGEARIAIDDYLKNPAGALPEPAHKLSRQSLHLWVAAAVIATLAAAVAWYWRPPTRNELIGFLVSSPAGTAFTIDAPAITLDGRTLTFISGSGGKTQLWIRSLDSSLPHPLNGTEGASAPFWSPDGRWIGFFADGKLRKVRVSGGPAQTLCDAPEGVGGTWGRDGTVLFAPSVTTGLYRVPDTGGAAVPVTTLDAFRRENSHRWPSFLPDGRHFLYFARSHDAENSGVFLGSLNSNETRQLWKMESNAVYVAAPRGKSGYLLAVQEGTLVARPFDANHLRFTAEAFPIAERVGRVTPGSAAFFSAASNVLVYGVGGLGDAVQLTRFDRSGKQLATLGSPGLYGDLRLSPDGKRLAVNALDPQGAFNDIYVFELYRGVASRLTFGPAVNVYAVWSPDGGRIVFASSRDGPENLYWKVSSADAAEQALLKSDVRKFPLDWSTDGRYILYVVVDVKTKLSLWVLPLSGDRRPFRLFETSFNEDDGRFSPDGKFLAYTSDESGRWEVYVESFRLATQPHKSAGKWRVSIQGGSQPHWRSDGKELFYLSDDNRIMAVPIEIGSSFVAGIPRQLFEAHLSREYDVQADGQRFLLLVPATEKSSEPVTVVINWTAGLNH